MTGTVMMMIMMTKMAKTMIMIMAKENYVENDGSRVGTYKLTVDIRAFKGKGKL